MAKIPDRIDKYEIKELIASGGMGEVYKGVHPTLERSVILKKLTLRGNASMTERFRREAKLLMDFRNDYIVDVYDHFVQGRSHYIVMEYVDGASVKDLLESERYFDNASAAYIALYTAKALAYAHRKSVIHRDVKPGNVLISRKGEIKLADFGIATSADSEADDENLTAEGMTLGTPAYMAPEQFKNSKNVDYRADLYSLGVMMYEMLVGRRPYSGGFSPEVIQQIQRGRYRKPRKVNPAVAPELQKIIVSLIKPRPKARCGDIAQVVSRLEKFLSRFQVDDVRNRVAAMVRSEEKPALRKQRRSPAGRAIAASLAVALLGGAAALFLSLTGIHRLALHPETYGLARIYASSADSPPETVLFADDNRTIPEYPRTIRYLPWKDGFASLPVALEAGQYRSKSRVNGRLVWTSFYVPPRLRSGGIAKVFLGAEKAGDSFVPVTTDIRDALTGRILDGVSECVVATSQGYVSVDAFGPVRIGSVQAFRVSAPGYYSQDFTLKIPEGIAELALKASLVPLSARIVFAVPGNGAGLTVRVNGVRSFPQVVNGLIVEKEADIGVKKEYAVLPGHYRIGVSDGGWKAEAEFLAGSEMRYTLTLRKDENRIKVEAQR